MSAKDVAAKTAARFFTHWFVHNSSDDEKTHFTYDGELVEADIEAAIRDAAAPLVKALEDVAEQVRGCDEGHIETHDLLKRVDTIVSEVTKDWIH